MGLQCRRHGFLEKIVLPKMKTFATKTDEDLEFVLILSLLSRKRVDVALGTSTDKNLALLRVFKCISPDSRYRIAGNMLHFTPGSLVGGSTTIQVQDICSVFRPLMLLSPFLKSDIRLEIEGITNGQESVDLFKITLYAVFKLFGIGGFALDIKRRGFAPEGGGSVSFKIDTVRAIENIDLGEKEELYKIRGVVITSRINSEFSRRMIGEIKSQMSGLANTKVLCIVSNRNDSGPSPGYECSVVAESRHGLFFSTCNTKELPEKMAKRCCYSTLKSIRRGGIFDSKLLPCVILYMGLAKGIGRLRTGCLDLQARKVLDLLNDFFGVEYKLVKAEDDNILTVVGCGYINPFKPL